MSEKIIVYDTFGNQISPKQSKIEKIIKAVSGKEIVSYLRQVPAYMQAVKDLLPTEVVKLAFSEQTLELLKEGAHFGNSKYGGFAANLYSKTGDLLGQASFTNESSFVFSPNLLSSVNQLMLQRQLGEIIARLGIINANIERVLVGQQIDRISLCESAEQQLLEASVISNDNLRLQMLANALQTAHQARSALFHTLIDDIGYLKDFRASLFGKNYEKDVRPRAQVARQLFLAYDRATKICATAYAGIEEYAAMIETLTSYEKYLTYQLPADTLASLNSIDSESDGFWLNEPPKKLSEISQFMSQSSSLTLEIPVSLLQGEI